jgi:hypothetical protein
VLSHPYLNVSLLGVVLGVSGCQSMSQIREPLRPGQGTVEVRMNPPRTLDVRNADGSRTSLDAVSRLQGEPVDVRRDSVVFRIDSWEGGNAAGDHEAASAMTVLPASDPQVGFYRDRISIKKNLLTVAIVIGLVALAIGQASVAYRYPKPGSGQV